MGVSFFVGCAVALFAHGGDVHDVPDVSAALRVEEMDGQTRVAVVAEDGARLVSPEEGLWSIATEWTDGWPASWLHGHPGTIERSGPWTVLRGAIDTPQGRWELRDAYRSYKGVIQGVRRFEWKGDKPATPCTLSVRFETPGSGPRVVMPGILYHGNPSGAKSGKTPVFEGRPGEEAFFEEHRYPMPFVSFEWPVDGACQGAALHTVPSYAPHANLPDQWWSLGAIACEGSTELALYSGPCASNGQRNVIKAVQPGFVPYGDAFLTVPPGAIIEKTFYLDAYPVAREGSGFQRPVRTALQFYPPTLMPDVPTFSEIIEAKYRYALTRWTDVGALGGFRKYADREYFVMGWCGQAAALGYALQVLEPMRDSPEAIDKAYRSLDLLSGARFYEGGFHTWFDFKKDRWKGDEPLSQGQAMLAFADAIRVGRKQEAPTSRWERFLRKACEFHAERILVDDWRPNSTDEAFFIAPLCKGYQLFSEKSFLDAAEKAGEVYAERSLSMREPYWGGTLDASCEDKEGAFAALQGFVALYETTGAVEYLEWAAHAGDATITYTVLWDIDLPPGRLRDHRFRTRGWTAVSAQNQHIDVYGVLIAPWVYRLGRYTHREDLQQLALLMYRSCGQLIDPFGSQGEQPQHTNYAQRGEVTDVLALRGGYVEDWTVFWITAHFLNAAAQFSELGVPMD
jgi:hypothetical protein